MHLRNSQHSFKLTHNYAYDRVLAIFSSISRIVALSSSRTFFDIILPKLILLILHNATPSAYEIHFLKYPLKLTRLSAFNIFKTETNRHLIKIRKKISNGSSIDLRLTVLELQIIWIIKLLSHWQLINLYTNNFTLTYLHKNTTTFGGVSENIRTQYSYFVG